jgi:hypothetical protein
METGKDKTVIGWLKMENKNSVMTINGKEVVLANSLWSVIYNGEFFDEYPTGRTGDPLVCGYEIEEFVPNTADNFGIGDPIKENVPEKITVDGQTYEYACTGNTEHFYVPDVYASIFLVYSRRFDDTQEFIAICETEEEANEIAKEVFIGIKKSYCTQNDGDCKNCSLVNYGLDCKNNNIYEEE